MSALGVGLLVLSAGGCDVTRELTAKADGTTKITASNPTGPRFRVDPKVTPDTIDSDGVKLDMKPAKRAVTARPIELAEMIAGEDLILAKVAIYEGRMRRDSAVLPAIVRRVVDPKTPDDIAAFALSAAAVFQTFEVDRLVRESLKDPRIRVRAAAAMAMAESQEPDRIAVLAELAKKPIVNSPEVDKRTVVILANNLAGVPIDQVLANPAPRLRMDACRTLVQLGMPELAIDGLMAVLDGPLEPTQNGRNPVREAAGLLAYARHVPAVPKVARLALRAPDADKPSFYIALARFGVPEAQAVLAREARSPTTDLRAAAYASYGYGADGMPHDWVLAGLDDPEPKVRREAALALGRKRIAQAEPILTARLETEKDESALRALRGALRSLQGRTDGGAPRMMRAYGGPGQPAFNPEAQPR